MRKILLLLSIFCMLAAQKVSAQAECFNIVDNTIVGVTYPTGISYIQDEGSLTIPASVKKITSTAFSSISSYGATLSTIIIEEGGNPEFELSDEEEDMNKNALASVNSSLANIEIHGTAMTVANIAKMLTGLDNDGTLEKIDIYNDAFPLNAVIASTNEDENALIDANTTGVKIVLPAARVGTTQKFGNADIYGRFNLTSELVTFCGSCYFQDTDDGSHFLFYIPTKIDTPAGKDEKMLFITRVQYVLPNKGVLLHKADDTTEKVELKRVDEDNLTDEQYYSDQTLFESNMLKGVTTPTTLTSTETEGGTEYVNMILSGGLFYRTSGGTLRANRAYLRVPKADAGSLAKLSMMVADDEPTGIESPPSFPPRGEAANGEASPWGGLKGAPIYDLQGRTVIDNGQLKKGIYIQNGRKILVTENR